jgi:hypothetical protein
MHSAEMSGNRRRNCCRQRNRRLSGPRQSGGRSGERRWRQAASAATPTARIWRVCCRRRGRRRRRVWRRAAARRVSPFQRRRIKKSDFEILFHIDDLSSYISHWPILVYYRWMDTLVNYNLKYISLCRWFRFAQLAKGKKSRP